MTDLLSIEPELLEPVLILLEVLLLVTALLATTSETVRQAVSYYQWQSGLLAVVTTATAISKTLQDNAANNVGILILFIALLPIVLAIAIRPLLYRATLSGGTESTAGDLKMIVAGIFGGPMEWVARRRRLDVGARTPGRPGRASQMLTRAAIRLQRYRALERDAESEWQRRQAMQMGLGSLVLFPFLLLVALLVPFVIETVEPLMVPFVIGPQGLDTFGMSERVGLSVSLALHLVGLYNMVVKRDIVSQVIGLLIMDHGLYLAVVKIVEIPVPAGLFVLSLYFYTLITIFILVTLLPQIRAKTGSIDLDVIAANSDLTS